MSVLVRLRGLTPYRAAHALQERLLALRADHAVPDVILLLTHAETITLGRHRDSASHVLAPDGVEVVEVERGGDATWHGPGQVVAYPIVALAGERRDLHGALRAIEAAVIEVIEALGVDAAPGRDVRNTGVWIDGHKVCSIGIACRHWVLWHGLALNVDCDLDGFARIRPCGFDADIMTRLTDHTSHALEIEPVAWSVGEALARHLGALRTIRLEVDLPDEHAISAVVDAIVALAAQGAPS